jgi:Protein of unknown function (DUF1254)
MGRFRHYREPMSIEFPIVRPNRDTLYSLSVFDLDAGPVTVTLPDAGERFMSMQVIDEDHYTPEVVYGRARTRIREKGSAPATYRLESAPRSREVRGGSKSPTGIRQARRRCATPFWRWPKLCPTPSARLGPETRSIQFGT